MAKICNSNSLPPIIMELGNGMEWVPQDFFPLQFRSFSTSMIMGGRVGSRVPIITRQPCTQPISRCTIPTQNPQKSGHQSKTIQLHQFHSSKKKQLYHFSKYHHHHHHHPPISPISPFTIQGTCWCSPPHFHCWDPDSPSRIVESDPWNPPC